MEKVDRGGRIVGDVRLSHGTHRAGMAALDGSKPVVPPVIKPTAFFRGATPPKGTLKGGMWPASPPAEGAVGGRQTVSAGPSEAGSYPRVLGPAPLPAGWRQTPFAWNEVLHHCSLECLALSTEKGLIFMGGKTESVAVYQLIIDPERDLLGFLKRPTGLTHCAKVGRLHTRALSLGRYALCCCTRGTAGPSPSLA
jgi:hypothetical protein